MSKQLVFWGTPQFAVPTLETVIELGLVSLVVTQPARPQGRGLRIVETPVAATAHAAGIPVLTPLSLADADLRVALQDLDHPCFLVVAYGKIIPQSLLDLSRPGVMNVHPSLLPNYRGPSPIQSVLLAQERRTGVTLIELDAEMDHGPIIAQEAIDIPEGATAEELSERAAKVSADLVRKHIRGYMAGELQPRPQEHSKATYCTMLTAEDALLDLTQPAAVLLARIRALQPWPGTYVLWGTKRLKIHAARILAETGRPNTLFSRSNAGNLLIQASDGALEALEVQLEGKPKMTAQAFLNGNPTILSA